jgi:hypothetical protein
VSTQGERRGPTRGARDDPSRGVLAEEPVDRRTLLRGALRAATGVGCAVGVPAALTGCATYVRVVQQAPHYAIVADLVPPGLSSMIVQRAGRLKVAAYVDPAAAVDQRAATFGYLGARSGSGGGVFSPITDQWPRDDDVIVVQAGTAADTTAHMLIGQGVKVVSYLAPLRYRTAQITVDAGSLAGLLAADAAAWAQEHRQGPVTALFIAAPNDSGNGPLSDGAPPESASVEDRAIRATFARLAPNITLRTGSASDDILSALNADPSLGIVLWGWDTEAQTYAQQLRRQFPSARREQLYLGGLGGPSLGGPEAGLTTVRQIIEELRRDDVLRAVATVRLSDLANALVELPVALLRKHQPYDIAVPPILLTPRSAALKVYARESSMSV